MPILQRPRHLAHVIVALVLLVAPAATQRQAPPREPASKAAAILF